MNSTHFVIDMVEFYRTRVHRSIFLLSSSLFVKALVSYSDNTRSVSAVQESSSFYYFICVYIYIYILKKKKKEKKVVNRHIKNVSFTRN